MSSHGSGMQIIDVENTRIESSAMHIESMLPKFISLSTSALTNHSKLMLKEPNTLTINYILRQSIIHIYQKSICYTTACDEILHASDCQAPSSENELVQVSAA